MFITRQSQISVIKSILFTGLSSLGVVGVPWHTQILTDQLTLFQPRGTDYAHLITKGTPGFSDVLTALHSAWSKLWIHLRSQIVMTAFTATNWASIQFTIKMYKCNAIGWISLFSCIDLFFYAPTISSNLVSNIGISLSEALLFAEHGENMLCTKIVLNVSSPQVWAWNFHVLNSYFNEQSAVILWVSWCKNKSFWQRFTFLRR